MNAPAKLDTSKLEKVAKRIASSVTRNWTLMEICGGQTSHLLEYKLDQMLPSNVNIVHGPGCAICITPVELIDAAIQIAQQPSVILCASGDLLRLRGTNCDLLEIKAQGADVRVVHSPLDCLSIARESPDKKVVFFSTGFEMTAQLDALSIWQAKRLGLKNYLLLGSHGHVPAVCKRILKEPNTAVQAIMGLGNVCNITGFVDYEQLSKRFQLPVVVTGHEPIDFMEGVEMCVRMLESGKISVENQFRSGVSRDGNREAKSLINEVFELVDREWRGIGRVELSGYRLKPEFQAHDARRVFDVKVESKPDSSACISKEILLGFKKPTDCPLFGKSCRPGSALGATMVSNEGTCATYYNYRHEH